MSLRVETSTGAGASNARSPRTDVEISSTPIEMSDSPTDLSLSPVHITSSPVSEPEQGQADDGFETIDSPVEMQMHDSPVDAMGSGGGWATMDSPTDMSPSDDVRGFDARRHSDE
jgi:hypothetical protein